MFSMVRIGKSEISKHIQRKHVEKRERGALWANTLGCVTLASETSLMLVLPPSLDQLAVLTKPPDAHP